MARKQAAANLYHKPLQTVSRGVDKRGATREERFGLSQMLISAASEDLPETVGLLVKSTVMRVRLPLPTESDHD
jgi:hypothetical protein